MCSFLYIILVDGSIFIYIKYVRFRKKKYFSAQKYAEKKNRGALRPCAFNGEEYLLSFFYLLDSVLFVHFFAERLTCSNHENAGKFTQGLTQTNLPATC